jgi:hypothetical protein
LTGRNLLKLKALLSVRAGESSPLTRNYRFYRTRQETFSQVLEKKVGKKFGRAEGNGYAGWNEQIK